MTAAAHQFLPEAVKFYGNLVIKTIVGLYTYKNFLKKNRNQNNKHAVGVLYIPSLQFGIRWK
jgi:hypothetical protein